MGWFVGRCTGRCHMNRCSGRLIGRLYTRFLCGHTRRHFTGRRRWTKCNRWTCATWTSCGMLRRMPSKLQYRYRLMMRARGGEIGGNIERTIWVDERRLQKFSGRRVHLFDFFTSYYCRNLPARSQDKQGDGQSLCNGWQGPTPNVHRSHVGNNNGRVGKVLFRPRVPLKSSELSYDRCLLFICGVDYV